MIHCGISPSVREALQQTEVKPTHPPTCHLQQAGSLSSYDELETVTRETGCLPPCRYAEYRIPGDAIETRQDYDNQATIALVKLATSKATLRKDITAEVWSLARTTLQNLADEVKTVCRD